MRNFSYELLKTDSGILGLKDRFKDSRISESPNPRIPESQNPGI
jgi:hypothetical protein